MQGFFGGVAKNRDFFYFSSAQINNVKHKRNSLLVCDFFGYTEKSRDSEVCIFGE